MTDYFMVLFLSAVCMLIFYLIIWVGMIRIVNSNTEIDSLEETTFFERVLIALGMTNSSVGVLFVAMRASIFGAKDIEVIRHGDELASYLDEVDLKEVLTLLDTLTDNTGDTSYNPDLENDETKDQE